MRCGCSSFCRWGPTGGNGSNDSKLQENFRRNAFESFLTGQRIRQKLSKWTWYFTNKTKESQMFQMKWQQWLKTWRKLSEECFVTFFKTGPTQGNEVSNACNLDWYHLFNLSKFISSRQDQYEIFLLMLDWPFIERDSEYSVSGK